MKTIAIFAAGGIAQQMAATLVRMQDEVCLYAVCSRTLEKAQLFAQEYGIPHAYGSYEEGYADPAIDIAYIASPHSNHFEMAKLALLGGKHVLCEKPLCVNRAQAQELMDLAKQKKLLLCEATWTRFMPFVKLLQEKLPLIGRAQLLDCSFGFPLEHVERMMTPELAGGALLDLGIYPLTMASICFGNEIAQVNSLCTKTVRGVDEKNIIQLKWRDGKLATLQSCLAAKLANSATIYGSKGSIFLKDFWHCEEITITQTDGHEEINHETISLEFEISGYEYEVRSVLRTLEQGELECEELPHAATLFMLGVMDDLRKAWGVQYPFE